MSKKKNLNKNRNNICQKFRVKEQRKMNLKQSSIKYKNI